ncbi:uncharacterized protein LOC108908535 [Anoplophora glabripennis]|uniref:uncharacterized protein LOC108908535 n=1 Tax=Anoplophora glabripennis TaxID=217634 RepID=UPI0008759EDA|nr:uncharacterized protein LOC108908535 [Anoplophora glabripennis]
MEIDDRLAAQIHGIISSDSDSDFDGKRDFDEEYNSLKPPPFDYESIRDRIVVISQRKVVNIWEERQKSIQKNYQVKIQATSSETTPKKKKKKKSKSKTANQVEYAAIATLNLKLSNGSPSNESKSPKNKVMNLKSNTQTQTFDILDTMSNNHKSGKKKITPLDIDFLDNPRKYVTHKASVNVCKGETCETLENTFEESYAIMEIESAFNGNLNKKKKEQPLSYDFDNDNVEKNTNLTQFDEKNIRTWDELREKYAYLENCASNNTEDSEGESEVWETPKRKKTFRRFDFFNYIDSFEENESVGLWEEEQNVFPYLEDCAIAGAKSVSGINKPKRESHTWEIPKRKEEFQPFDDFLSSTENFEENDNLKINEEPWKEVQKSLENCAIDRIKTPTNINTSEKQSKMLEMTKSKCDFFSNFNLNKNLNCMDNIQSHINIKLPEVTSSATEDVLQEKLPNLTAAFPANVINSGFINENSNTKKKKFRPLDVNILFNKGYIVEVEKKTTKTKKPKGKAAEICEMLEKTRKLEYIDISEASIQSLAIKGKKKKAKKKSKQSAEKSLMNTSDEIKKATEEILKRVNQTCKKILEEITEQMQIMTNCQERLNHLLEELTTEDIIDNKIQLLFYSEDVVEVNTLATDKKKTKKKKRKSKKLTDNEPPKDQNILNKLTTDEDKVVESTKNQETMLETQLDHFSINELNIESIQFSLKYKDISITAPIEETKTKKRRKKKGKKITTEEPQKIDSLDNVDHDINSNIERTDQDIPVIQIVEHCKENSANVSEQQQKTQENIDFQEDINTTKGTEVSNVSINTDSVTSISKSDKDIVILEYVFSVELKNFIRNIDCSNNIILNTNIFNYEQLYRAYTVFIQKNNERYQRLVAYKIALVKNYLIQVFEDFGEIYISNKKSTVWLYNMIKEFGKKTYLCMSVPDNVIDTITKPKTKDRFSIRKYMSKSYNKKKFTDVILETVNFIYQKEFSSFGKTSESKYKIFKQLCAFFKQNFIAHSKNWQMHKKNLSKVVEVRKNSSGIGEIILTFNFEESISISTRLDIAAILTQSIEFISNFNDEQLYKAYTTHILKQKNLNIDNRHQNTVTQTNYLDKNSPIYVEAVTDQIRNIFWELGSNICPNISITGSIVDMLTKRRNRSRRKGTCCKGKIEYCDNTISTIHKSEQTINIITNKTFEKEFPSLDERKRNSFTHMHKISWSGCNNKKKKRKFVPLLQFTSKKYAKNHTKSNIKEAKENIQINSTIEAVDTKIPSPNIPIQAKNFETVMTKPIEDIEKKQTINTYLGTSFSKPGKETAILNEELKYVIDNIYFSRNNIIPNPNISNYEHFYSFFMQKNKATYQNPVSYKIALGNDLVKDYLIENSEANIVEIYFSKKKSTVWQHNVKRKFSNKNYLCMSAPDNIINIITNPEAKVRFSIRKCVGKSCNMNYNKKKKLSDIVTLDIYQNELSNFGGLYGHDINTKEKKIFTQFCAFLKENCTKVSKNWQMDKKNLNSIVDTRGNSNISNNCCFGELTLTFNVQERLSIIIRLDLATILSSYDITATLKELDNYSTKEHKCFTQLINVIPNFNYEHLYKAYTTHILKPKNINIDNGHQNPVTKTNYFDKNAPLYVDAMTDHIRKNFWHLGSNIYPNISLTGSIIDILTKRRNKSQRKEACRKREIEYRDNMISTAHNSEQSVNIGTNMLEKEFPSLDAPKRNSFTRMHKINWSGCNNKKKKKFVPLLQFTSKKFEENHNKYNIKKTKGIQTNSTIENYNPSIFHRKIEAVDTKIQSLNIPIEAKNTNFENMKKTNTMLKPIEDVESEQKKSKQLPAELPSTGSRNKVCQNIALGCIKKKDTFKLQTRKKYKDSMTTILDEQQISKENVGITNLKNTIKASSSSEINASIATVYKENFKNPENFIQSFDDFKKFFKDSAAILEDCKHISKLISEQMKTDKSTTCNENLKDFEKMSRKFFKVANRSATVITNCHEMCKLISERIQKNEIFCNNCMEKPTLERSKKLRYCLGNLNSSQKSYSQVAPKQSDFTFPSKQPYEKIQVDNTFDAPSRIEKNTLSASEQNRHVLNKVLTFSGLPVRKNFETSVEQKHCSKDPLNRERISLLSRTSDNKFIYNLVKENNDFSKFEKMHTNTCFENPIQRIAARKRRSNHGKTRKKEVTSLISLLFVIFLVILEILVLSDWRNLSLFENILWIFVISLFYYICNKYISIYDILHNYGIC